MSNSCEQGKSAPENSPDHDDEFPRITVRQGTDKRRCDHVAEQEGAGQISHLCFVDVEFVLHQRLHGIQDIPVNIVQQVQRGEYCQRCLGVEVRLGHGSSEYSMCAEKMRVARLAENNRLQREPLARQRLTLRPFASFAVFSSSYFNSRDLGHFATTTVEIPPRGRKSPFTSAHAGFAQRTTSSST